MCSLGLFIKEGGFHGCRTEFTSPKRGATNSRTLLNSHRLQFAVRGWTKYQPIGRHCSCHWSVYGLILVLRNLSDRHRSRSIDLVFRNRVWHPVCYMVWRVGIRHCIYWQRGRRGYSGGSPLASRIVVRDRRSGPVGFSDASLPIIGSALWS